MSDVATTRLPRTLHRLRGVDGDAVLRAPGTWRPYAGGPGLVGHIFLIFKYLRISGKEVTASSTRAAAAAVVVTAVMYPSVRIVCLLFFS
jgi:hypothetical protein